MRTTSPSWSTQGPMIRTVLTSVPFDDPRSSSVQAPPICSSSACARETSPSHGSASSQLGSRPTETRCRFSSRGTIRSASSPSRYSRKAVPRRSAASTALSSAGVRRCSPSASVATIQLYAIQSQPSPPRKESGCPTRGPNHGPATPARARARVRRSCGSRSRRPGRAATSSTPRRSRRRSRTTRRTSATAATRGGRDRGAPALRRRGQLGPPLGGAEMPAHAAGCQARRQRRSVAGAPARLGGAPARPAQRRASRPPTWTSGPSARGTAPCATRARRARAWAGRWRTRCCAASWSRPGGSSPASGCRRASSGWPPRSSAPSG